MSTHELAHLASGFRPRLDGGANAPNVTFDQRGDLGGADLHSPRELHVGRLEHGVGCFDHAHQAFGLDETECLAVAGRAVGADT